MKSVDLETIYAETPEDEIPWISKEPPSQLVGLLDSSGVLPCKAVDLGCGTGNHALYLASRGFDVTGIELSETAVRIAREKAKDRGLAVRFVSDDLRSSHAGFDAVFAFAFEWQVLHHILPEERPGYLANVAKMLAPGATYFALFFSDKDPSFGGSGKLRQTSIGTVLYFSDETEIRELYRPHFSIRELSEVVIPGVRGEHVAWCALAHKD